MNDICWPSRAPMRRIKPFFQSPDGVTRVDDGNVVSGVVFLVENALRWRDAPSACEPQKTLDSRCARWSRKGAFDRTFVMPAAHGDATDEALIPSRGLRATRHRAAGAAYLKAQRTAAAS